MAEKEKKRKEKREKEKKSMIIVVPSCLKDADGARTRSDQNDVLEDMTNKLNEFKDTILSEER
jgi:hypothetical protein